MNVWDAELENWTVVEFARWLPGRDGFVLAGMIKGDKKQRFPNGRRINTSFVITPRAEVGEGAIVETLNTRYKLGHPAEADVAGQLVRGALSRLIRLPPFEFDSDMDSDEEQELFHTLNIACIGQVAVRTFLQIGREWGLNAEEKIALLGLSGPGALSRLEQNPAQRITRDQVERISYVIGIYNGLHGLFSDRARAVAWLRAPNKAHPFGGSTALTRMTAGNVSDLYVVRKFIDTMLVQ